MHIEAFIQARMGSTRLPGKVLKTVLGKPLLEYLVERIAQTKEIDDFVILTSHEKSDDPIVSFCHKHNIAAYRGSEDDVLDRYYQAALLRKPDGIVRITADCPLIDPDVIDQVVQIFRQDPHVDYISNAFERTFPRGLDVEVFSFHALQQAAQQAIRPEEREHVTVYMYRHPEIFKLKNVAHKPSMGNYRWTVDTPEDFALIRLILENLYPSNPHFRMKDILRLLAQHPTWSELNAHIEQKKFPPAFS